MGITVCRIKLLVAFQKTWQSVLGVVWLMSIAFALASVSSASSNVIIDVKNAGELSAALKSAQGGEIIRLAPGQYGDLRLSGKDNQAANYKVPVTVRSADPKAPAVFSAVSLTQASNLRFENLEFDYVAAPAASLSTSPFKVMESSDIAFEGVVFDGDLATGVNPVEDGYGAGRGLIVRKSENITVENSFFRNWYRAAAFGKVKGLRVVGNEVIKSSSDGFDFSQVENVLISNNHLHDFQRAKGSSAHADMIQFWTSGTDAPSRDITITNNFIDMGAGTSAQSIFMRNERVDQGDAGADMFYQNVRIANNVIANRHQHGITVGETNGLVIEQNTVVQKAGAPSETEIPLPTIKVAKSSTNVKVIKNIASRFGGMISAPPSGWTVSQNIEVSMSDKTAQNYVGRILARPLEAKTAAWSDFMLSLQATDVFKRKGEPLPGATNILKIAE